jgi:hypothetical protein
VQNRWLPVVGGLLMNLALGSLYAWSVFVPPLEREFGWSRAETSWVYTIAIVCFALTFVAAGRLQDVRGPKVCALAGGILVSAGFVLASFTTSLAMLYLFYGVIVGVGNGFGYATPTPVGSKWFPGSPRPGRRPDGRRLRRRVRNLWHTGQRLAGAVVRLARDVPDSRRHLLRHDDGGNRTAEKPACRIPSTELVAFGRRCRARGILDVSDARNTGVLLAVDCVLPRDRRPAR